jgi:hypothetical protein
MAFKFQIGKFLFSQIPNWKVPLLSKFENSFAQVSRRLHLQSAGRMVVPFAVSSICPNGTLGLLRKMGFLPGRYVATTKVFDSLHMQNE